MTEEAAKQAALEVWDLSRQLLPNEIANNLKLHSSDPARLKKGDTDIVRMRILPIKKRPQNFWSSTWCFYEIGVGIYARSSTIGLNTGGVAFVQFPYQKSCGKGKYLQPAANILKSLTNRNFQFSIAPGNGETWTQMFRRYQIKDFPQFPATQAADDLTWLIRESLPLIEAIP